MTVRGVGDGSISAVAAVERLLWDLPLGVRVLALLVAPIAMAAVAIAVMTVPLAVAAVAAVAAVLLAAVYAPGVIFAAFLLIPFYKAAVQDYVPVDITILLALLNMVQIVPLLVRRRLGPISRIGVFLWIALALLVLGGVLYSPDEAVAQGRATLFLALVVLPIPPAALRVGSRPRYLLQLVWSLWAMGAVIVVLGLLALPSASSSSAAPIVVLGSSTITVSRGALLIPLLGVVFVWIEGPALLRLVALLLIPVALLVALASGSRGPLLMLAALAAIGVIRAAMRPRAIDWRLVGALAALGVASVVIVSVAATILPGQSLDRFSRFGDFIQSSLTGDLNTSVGDTSSGARVTLFELAISLFAAQPLLGVGTAGFEVLAPRYLSATEVDRYPHNAFLQFGAEFGMVGLLLFSALVFFGLTRRLPGRSPWRAVRVTFLFFLLNAMVTGDILEDRMLWGLLLLLYFADPGPPEPVEVRVAPPAPATDPVTAVTPPGPRRRRRDRTRSGVPA